MKIMVTGGAGFIGANFIYYELREHPEDRIICYDALTYAGNIATLNSAREYSQFSFVQIALLFIPFLNRSIRMLLSILQQSHMWIALSRHRRSSFKRTLLGRVYCLMHAANMELNAIIRYRRMRFMVTYHWIVRIFSLQRRRRCIPLVRILPPRHLPISLCRHMHVPMECL